MGVSPNALESFEDIVAALQSPDAYPHPVEGEIRVIRTHSAAVILAGDRVYKVKKPVDLGFLDFTQPEHRRFICQEEVRLNRALAPGVYIGVVPIRRNSAGRITLLDEGETIEHAVKMVRLPEEGMLSSRLEKAPPDKALLGRIAEILQRFHAGASSGQSVSKHASPDALRTRTLDPIKTIDRLISEQAERTALPDTVGELIGHVRHITETDLERLRPVFRTRIADTRIREGHGDLHAGNICLYEDRIVIYDRLEFSVALRCVDTAADLAFLTMDLRLRGYRDAAVHLTQRYAMLSGDEDPDTGLEAVTPFYLTHRAVIRAMAASLRAEGAKGEAIDEAWAEATRYLALAAGLHAPPSLIITCGLPGTGKSTVARAIAASLGADWWRADEERKRMAGFAPNERPGPSQQASLYSPEQTDRTYTRLLELAAESLNAGHAVVLDATYASQARRQAARELASKLGVPFRTALIECDDQEVRRRLRARTGDAAEVSDADETVYDKVRASFETPDHNEPGLTRIQGYKPPPFAAAAVVASLLNDR